MVFKGEIALGALNTNYKYGFTVGDIYRVQGAGNLVPNNLPVANGAFVKWTADGWEVQSDMQYAVSESGESADKLVADLIKKTPFTPSVANQSFAKELGYVVGDYVPYGKEIWVITADQGKDPEDSDYEIYTVQKLNGIVAALNRLVSRNDIPLDDLGETSDTDLTDSTLAIEASNSYTVLHVTTATAITILANPGLGNFAVLIDNGTNASDVTITVKDSTNTNTYLHSSAAGTDVAAGKIAQLTCVGTCWTLAEFEA